MKAKLSSLIACSLLAAGQAIACAPSGSASDIIDPACDSFNVSFGTHISAVDARGDTYSVKQSVGDSLSYSFGVGSGLSIDGIQLIDYFTTENGSPDWDDFGATIYVDDIEVASISFSAAHADVAFQGYKSASSAYWYVNATEVNTYSPGGLQFGQGGGTLTIELTNLHTGPNTGDTLNVSELHIFRSCPIPEPSSALLAGLACLALIAQRRR